MAAGMTPGYAKTRQELPWLYYPESDSVIINAHNFGGVFSPAVNGKMPIAAWVPTRTQDATDSAGSNDGTLTNGATVGSVSGEGGSYAFVLDGINDYVNCGDNASLQNLAGGDLSISAWFRFASTTAPTVARRIASKRASSIPNRGWIFARNTVNSIAFVVVNAGGVSSSASSVITDTLWHHALAVWDATTGTSAIYIDGASDTASATSATGAAVDTAGDLKIGSSFNFSANAYWSGDIDDVRMWASKLDGTDAADLATGRGVNVT